MCSSDLKDAFEYRVVAGDFTVLETVGSAGDREHELGDELFGCVATVAAGLGQTRLRQCSVKFHVLKHALHQTVVSQII